MSKELIERLRSGITLYGACLENPDKHMLLLSEAADLIEKVERRTIERCAEVAHNFWLDQVDDSTESAQRAIRALPTGNLKLEDLK